MQDVQKVLDTLNARPNIIVFGVGHSGTTVLARIINTLGWNIKGPRTSVDTTHWECANMVEVNAAYLGEIQDGKRTDRCEPGSAEFREGDARYIFKHLPKPWVVKDPRLVWCFDQWLRVFEDTLEELPLMVYLTRNSAALARSYSKEGQPAHTQMLLEEQVRAQRVFDEYEGPKFHLEFEAIVTAAARVKLNVDNLERLNSL